MGSNTSIEWCDATFNPWWGCLKVSPGCQHCYAETWDARYGGHHWGPATTTERRTFGDKHWNEPLKWNKLAEKEGVRKRVFCASMADVFEDHPQLITEREMLWTLIQSTTHLDWLLLTKRPENIIDMVPHAWLDKSPHNVWYGTSVENQEAAVARIPHLLATPAAVRFLSCEPLLGAVDLHPWVGHWAWVDRIQVGETVVGARVIPTYREIPKIHWVIAGGESGAGARPMHPDWARGLRDQCQAAGVAFHFKQYGEWIGVDQLDAFMRPGETVPPNTREYVFSDGTICFRLGKKRAGRLLDGRTWDEFPEVVHAE